MAEYTPAQIERLARRVAGFEHTWEHAKVAERAARQQRRMAAREWHRALREWRIARTGVRRLGEPEPVL